jgi:hypothetical protein
MFAVMSAAVTAATLGATAAMNGVGYAISHGRGGVDGGSSPGGGSGAGKGPGGGKENTSVADRSSQQAPKPPDGNASEGARGSDGNTSGSVNGSRAPESAKTAETSSTNVGAGAVAARESNSSAQNGGAHGSGGVREGHGSSSQKRPSPFNARVYTPMSLTAMASAEAGMLLGTAYRKTANALRSRSGGDEDKG